jgi:multiple sugar transport system substrate-binding protein
MAQLSRVVPWQDYPGPNFAQIEALLENSVQSVAFGGADAATTLAQAQSQASSLLR